MDLPEKQRQEPAPGWEPTDTDGVALRRRSREWQRRTRLRAVSRDWLQALEDVADLAKVEGIEQIEETEEEA